MVLPRRQQEQQLRPLWKYPFNPRISNRHCRRNLQGCILIWTLTREVVITLPLPPPPPLPICTVRHPPPTNSNTTTIIIIIIIGTAAATDPLPPHLRSPTPIVTETEDDSTTRTGHDSRENTYVSHMTGQSSNAHSQSQSHITAEDLQTLTTYLE